MERYFCYIFILFVILKTGDLYAQDEGDEPDDIEFIIERSQPITIDLEEEAEEEDPRKKKEKRKKNVFYGIKTKKGYTRSGYGDNTTVEIFHYLKEWQEPDSYVPDIYWFDFRRKRIRNTGTIDKKYGRILHGPYTRITGGQLIEQGIYYIGTKHGRWIKLDKNDVLVDKKKYYKGWPKESLVKYYDDDREKLKEVLPVVYGEIEGDYYYFHENGEVAVKGQYDYGEKIGRWTEYFDIKLRAKKQIQYKSDPYENDFLPYTYREWNRRGQQVFDGTNSRKN